MENNQIFENRMKKEGIVDMVAGPTYGLGVGQSGSVYVWGHTRVSNTINIKNLPEEVANNTVDVVNLAAGTDHVVALTSETEGWGLALTEGQAMGCIGVAFGCTSGIKEVLSPNCGCGFVVPPFDEGKYADILLAIAAMDDNERMTIRRRAVERTLKYAPEVISEKWRVLFEYLKQND
jgi:glycosyltransferase involved in cell wall biosynthesis